MHDIDIRDSGEVIRKHVNYIRIRRREGDPKGIVKIEKGLTNVNTVAEHIAFRKFNMENKVKMQGNAGDGIKEIGVFLSIFDPK